MTWVEVVSKYIQVLDIVTDLVSCRDEQLTLTSLGRFSCCGGLFGGLFGVIRSLGKLIVTYYYYYYYAFQNTKHRSIDDI